MSRIWESSPPSHPAKRIKSVFWRNICVIVTGVAAIAVAAIIGIIVGGVVVVVLTDGGRLLPIFDTIRHL